MEQYLKGNVELEVDELINLLRIMSSNRFYFLRDTSKVLVENKAVERC